MVVLGGGDPDAQVVQVAELGEGTEARLVLASGTIADVDRAKSGTTTILEDASGRGRIVGLAGAGTLPDSLRRGASAVITGIAGQRSSANGRLDGYRIWVRDGGDIEVEALAPPPSPSGSADPSAAPTPALVTIAVARSRSGQKVTVEGTVTSQVRLLDADGRRVTIEDSTGGILLRVTAREAAPPVGSRVRVAGSVGTYYGAPQLSASGPVQRLGSAAVAPTRLPKAPTSAFEWQLVRVEGTVREVKRTGQSWRAELAIPGGARVPIVGLARAAISADRIREGQHGAIVGFVRRATRPRPTAASPSCPGTRRPRPLPARAPRQPRPAAGRRLVEMCRGPGHRRHRRQGAWIRSAPPQRSTSGISRRASDGSSMSEASSSASSPPTNPAPDRLSCSAMAAAPRRPACR
jgi:hypothetical protein